MRWKDLYESITAYHGSGSGHAAFEPKHTGENSHTFGSYTSDRHGIFFTTNPKFAAIYGDVMEYELNINQTYNMDENDSMIFKFLDWMKESNHDEWHQVREIILREPHWQLFEGEIGELFVGFLKSHGYDSATFVEEHEIEGEEVESQTIVVFNPSKVIKQGQYELDLWEELVKLQQ